MGAIVAVINKNGENAAEQAVAMLKTLSHIDAEAFGIASSSTVKIEKTAEKLANASVNSPLIIGHVFSKIISADKPQPVKLENATLVFEGRNYQTPLENAAETFAKKIQDNPTEKAVRLINETDGDFTFAIAEKERLLAGRDPLGIRPLYLGKNEHLMALASERKALRKIGIENAYPFPPGKLLIANKRDFEFLHAKTLTRQKASNITIQEASETIKTVLKSSVTDRVAGIDKIAVAFSGGLDSSLIAILAKKANVEVHLIHVSLESQPETEHAKKVAEELELPIHVYTYNADDVKETMEKALWLTEEPNPLKVSIGIPMCWAAEKTAKMGFKVLLAGQGADELFGGYKRYATAYATHGEKKTEEMMFNDVLTINEANVERDFKICDFHGVELRLPFLTYDMVGFAIKLPLKLKIALPDDGMRKLVLRHAAKSFGLPKSVLEKPKKAVQYATGVDKTLRKLAKQENLSLTEWLMKEFQKTFEKLMKNG